MKLLKFCIALLLIFTLVWGQINVWKNANTTNSLGGYSDICGTITESDRQWVLEHFGHCKTVSELMLAVEEFACQNFRYTKEALRFSQKIFQYFEMASFIASEYQGVCFDFACFCKNVILIVCEANAIPVQAYVCAIKYTTHLGHAVNIIYTEDGTGYYLDLTADSTYYRTGQEELIWGPVSIGDQTPDAFLKDISPDVWLTLLY